jgi:LuxR family maltose regulon positive regulatory protein
MTGFFAQPVATAAILLQNRTQTFLHKADQMLGNMETYLAASHIDLFYIHVLALHSLLYAACGQHAKALEALEHAVRLAQPGNVQRAFLDVGPALNDLLAQLNLASPYGGFVRQLCAGNVSAGSLAHTTVSGNRPEPSGNANPLLSSSLRKQPRHPDLIELLTNRELEILQLLALRLTNKEIAGALNISTGTVKQHTINLFRKLHVENRRQAIVQARAMGFQIEMPYPL